MAVRQVRRKIIGAEHSHDAMRLVSHRGSCAHASFKPLLSCSFSIGGNGNLHLVDDAVAFRKRFPNGLAGFASNQVSELEIGRASCRERGCQYVWISVVAVSL